MAMPGQTKKMRRLYEQSEWIEQKRRDAKAGRLFVLTLLGVFASMAALYSFLLFTLL